MTRGLVALALVVAAAAPAAAQQRGTRAGLPAREPTQRISLEPYAGYGFYGSLPRDGGKLEAAPAFGGRAALQVTPQFALYGEYQRSQPKVSGGVFDRKATVDHWSSGVEFSYVPRGGAEGMLPVLLEAGVGQARYDFTEANIIGSEPKFQDTAAKLGLASALRLTPNFGIRYGVSDYISNFRKDLGMVNHVFVDVGAELRF